MEKIALNLLSISRINKAINHAVSSIGQREHVGMRDGASASIVNGVQMILNPAFVHNFNTAFLGLFEDMLTPSSPSEKQSSYPRSPALSTALNSICSSIISLLPLEKDDHPQKDYYPYCKKTSTAREALHLDAETQIVPQLHEMIFTSALKILDRLNNPKCLEKYLYQITDVCLYCVKPKKGTEDKRQLEKEYKEKLQEVEHLEKLYLQAKDTQNPNEPFLKNKFELAKKEFDHWFLMQTPKPREFPSAENDPAPTFHKQWKLMYKETATRLDRLIPQVVYHSISEPASASIATNPPEKNYFRSLYKFPQVVYHSISGHASASIATDLVVRDYIKPLYQLFVEPTFYSGAITQVLRMITGIQPEEASSS